ncbi:transposase domain-containing protein, partial [Escherichia coli]
LFTSFSGSLVSRISGAVQLYGLIGTCLLNDIDPEAYLRHILSVLPE